jgi:hypothetical protein
MNTQTNFEYKNNKYKLKYLDLLNNNEQNQDGGFMNSLKKALGFGIVWKETDRVKNIFNHTKIGSITKITKDDTTKKITIYVKYDGNDNEEIVTENTIIKPTDESFDELKERLNKELNKLNEELADIQSKYDNQKPIADNANTIAKEAQTEMNAAKKEEDLALKKKNEMESLYKKKLYEIENLTKRIAQLEKDNKKLIESIEKDKFALDQTKIESTTIFDNVNKTSAIELEKLNILNSKLADSDVKTKEANKEQSILNEIDNKKSNLTNELNKIRKLLDKTTTEESTLLAKQN